MKKMISLLLFTAVSVFASAKTLPKPTQIIPFMELTSGMAKELATGKHPEIAIECREGTALPLEYLGNFGLFSVSLKPNLGFKIERTCYLRFPTRRAYLSFDLVHWEKPKRFFQGKPDADVKINRATSTALLETNLLPVTESPE